MPPTREETKSESRFHIPNLRNPFDGAEPLRAAEIKALKPHLVDALRYLWEYADLGISETNKAHAKAYIWQTIDDEETEKIAEFMLKRGARSGAAAQIVRGTVEAYTEIEILIMIGPRFWSTWQFYRANGGIGL